MLLEIKDLNVGYGKTQITHNLCLTVMRKEIVCLIGHNGAGKSTTLKAIFGLLKPYSGSIIYEGQNITYSRPKDNIKRGICFIPQERAIFASLTVRENLELGIFTLEDKPTNFESVFDLFPVLKQRLTQIAGTLSGGERKMLSVAMALLRRPQLLIIDEPSLGLSPVLTQELLATIKESKDNLGMTILLVEQNLRQAFKISERVYVMKVGKIIMEETGQKLLERGQWWDLF